MIDKDKIFNSDISKYIFHETDLGIILNGDCLEILPLIKKNSVDLVLTDPPYGIGKSKNSIGSIGKEREKKRNYLNYEDTIENYLNIILPRINFIINNFNNIVITPGSINFWRLPPPKSLGMLYFPASISVHSWGFADCQPIYYYGKNPRNKNTTKCSYKITNFKNEFDHPCPKPLNVWQEILKNTSLENNLILDCFSGSGTTAIACENLNRKWICIEKEIDYCKITKKRIEQLPKYQFLRELF